MTAPFNCTVFYAYVINSLRFSEELIFHISLPRLLFFIKKGNLKFFRFKNVMERGIRKVLSFVIGEIASEVFGKIKLNPL